MAVASRTSELVDVELDSDVAIIGAGVAGLYALHALRGKGFTAKVFEQGDGVGGTWYWNRYPGARVDVQSVEYMLTKFPDLEQEWDWSELMPAQSEVERYLNYVADRLDLRRDIQFNSPVAAARYDEESATWTVETRQGESHTSRFLMAATGCLSAPLEPTIEGRQLFAGESLYTSRFPAEGYDFTGKRVAIIGTGSSGVQSVPVIAKQAARVYVLQRSAAFTIPSPNRPLGPVEQAELKAQYPEIRKAQWAAPNGTARVSALFLGVGELPDILDTPWEEQLSRVAELGISGAFAWADVATNMEVNRAARKLYAEAIRGVVKDTQTAEDLVPDYPFGCKRIILDEGYFETFNEDHVQLVNLRRNPIVEITPGGIQLLDEFIDLDVIVYATGFDAMTGALSRIDIRGREGRSLRETWEEAPHAYLGLGVEGFPNLFTITGPGSPSVLANMVCSIEQHVDWVVECVDNMRRAGHCSIEAQAEAQTAWAEYVHTVARPAQVHESCSSWYLGLNVPGKRRYYMPYAGGLQTYMAKCDEIVANGYVGFDIE